MAERYESEREAAMVDLFAQADQDDPGWDAPKPDWGTELVAPVGETITLDGPVQVEFRDADGSVRGIASVGKGGQLNLTGVEGITFVAVPYEAERWDR